MKDFLSLPVADNDKVLGFNSLLLNCVEFLGYFVFRITAAMSEQVLGTSLILLFGRSCHQPSQLQHLKCESKIEFQTFQQT